MPPSFEDIPNGTDREILLVLLTKFQIFTQNQERTNQSHNEKLLELLHKQDQKADKLDLAELKHQLSSKAEKEDVLRLEKQDSEILKRVNNLEDRNKVVDSETNGRKKAFAQVRALGARAWFYIAGIITFAITILKFLDK